MDPEHILTSDFLKNLYPLLDKRKTSVKGVFLLLLLKKQRRKRALDAKGRKAISKGDMRQNKGFSTFMLNPLNRFDLIF